MALANFQIRLKTVSASTPLKQEAEQILWQIAATTATTVSTFFNILALCWLWGVTKVFYMPTDSWYLYARSLMSHPTGPNTLYNLSLSAKSLSQFLSPSCTVYTSLNIHTSAFVSRKLSVCLGAVVKLFHAAAAVARRRFSFCLFFLSF